MPAVFCASFEPCERLNAAAERSCSLRKYLSILEGVELRNIQCTITISEYADAMPISGAPTIIFSVNGHSPVGTRISASTNDSIREAGDVMVLAVFMAFVGFKGLVSNSLAELQQSGPDLQMVTTNGTTLLPAAFLYRFLRRQPVSFVGDGAP